MRFDRPMVFKGMDVCIYLHQQTSVGDVHFHLKFALKVTHL